MLPHHQLLAEMDNIGDDLRPKYKADIPVISELYAILDTSSFE
jgi:hypothetical protein